jgi:hypothetical protein
MRKLKIFRMVFMEKSKVYYTKEISSDSLIKIFDSLGVTLKGKVGVKVSTGEDGAKGYLKKEKKKKKVKKKQKS